MLAKPRFMRLVYPCEHPPLDPPPQRVVTALHAAAVDVLLDDATVAVADIFDPRRAVARLDQKPAPVVDVGNRVFLRAPRIERLYAGDKPAFVIGVDKLRAVGLRRLGQTPRRVAPQLPCRA